MPARIATITAMRTVLRRSSTLAETPPVWDSTASLTATSPLIAFAAVQQQPTGYHARWQDDHVKRCTVQTEARHEECRLRSSYGLTFSLGRMARHDASTTLPEGAHETHCA